MFIKNLWNGLFGKKGSSTSAIAEKPKAVTVTMQEDITELNHGSDISAITEQHDDTTITMEEDAISFEEAKPYLIQQLKEILEKTREQPDNFSKIREDLVNDVADMIQTTTLLKSTKYPNEISKQFEKELLEFVKEVREYTGFIVLRVCGDDGLLKLGFLLGKEAYGVSWKEN